MGFFHSTTIYLPNFQGILMSIHNSILLSIALSTLCFAKPYHNEDSTKSSSNNITRKIKQDFNIPKKIDHKSTLKPKKHKPKKIKKDRGLLASND